MFWSAVLGSAVIGLIGSLIALNSHYLLLIQALPYRTLWLLEFLAIPAGYEMAARLAMWRPSVVRCELGRRIAPYLELELRSLEIGRLDLACTIGPRGSLSWIRSGSPNQRLALEKHPTRFPGDDRMHALVQHPRRLRPVPNQALFQFGVPSGLYRHGRLAFVVQAAISLVNYYRILAGITNCRQRLSSFAALVVLAGYQALLLWAPSSCWYAKRFEVGDARVRFVDSSLSHRVVGRANH